MFVVRLNKILVFFCSPDEQGASSPSQKSEGEDPEEPPQFTSMKSDHSMSRPPNLNDGKSDEGPR